MSRQAVQRGKAWERQVARDLSDATGELFRRVLRESRDGNAGDVRGPRIVVQAKCGKRPPIYDALHEAVEAAAPEELPVAAVMRMNGRGRGSERFAVVPWEDFCELVGRLA